MIAIIAPQLYLTLRTLDMAPSLAGHIGDVSDHGRARRVGPRVEGWVLEPLDLADPKALPPYWNFLWCLNPQTYCSSQSSSGSPLKSSTAEEEAGAAAVCPFAQPPNPLGLRRTTVKPNPDRKEGDSLA